MKNFLFGMLVVVFVGSLTAAGYFYTQNKALTNLTGALVSTTPSSTPAETLTLSPSDMPLSSTTPKPTESNKDTKTVVVFKGGVSSSPDKDELTKKIVNPYVDYYQDQYESGYLVSLTISENPYPSKTTSPYTGSGVFKNGGNEGFVIDKNNGVISWWAPSCMVCKFSDTYKSKYPEVVKNF